MRRECQSSLRITICLQGSEWDSDVENELDPEQVSRSHGYNDNANQQSERVQNVLLHGCVTDKGDKSDDLCLRRCLFESACHTSMFSGIGQVHV